MSFISGAFDKSVFNKGSYKAAVGEGNNNGYAVVRITPTKKRLLSEKEDPVIVGVLNTEDGGFGFSVDSNWKDMGNVASSVLPGVAGKVVGAYEMVNNIGSVAGMANLGAAYSSKLIYQQSGYLEIKIPMMVVDWNGKGQPLLSAMLLAYYCLPKYVANVGEAIKAVEEQIMSKVPDFFKGIGNAGLEAGSNVGYWFDEGIKLADKKLGAAGGALADSVQTLKAVAGGAKETIEENLEDAYTLRSSPVPVIIEIGQFFKHHNMVIKNINFEFSKEMTRMGPLYAKFNISLSSRMIMVDLEDTGLQYLGNESRYMESSSNLT